MVKSLVLSDGAAAELLAEVAGADAGGADDDEEEDVDDEQPAATRATLAARATQPSRGRILNVPWPC